MHSFLCYALFLFSFINIHYSLKPAYLLTNSALNLSEYPLSSKSNSYITTEHNINESILNDEKTLPVVLKSFNEVVGFNKDVYFRILNTSLIGKNIIYAEKVSSTQDQAEDFYSIPGLVVIANEQTMGRGRGGNTWFSPKGDLMMSTIVNVTHPSKASSLQSIGALSLVNAVHEKRNGYQQLDVMFSWPNSVTWGSTGTKIGGILVEKNQMDPSFYTIGFGLRLSSRESYPTLNKIINDYNSKHENSTLQPLLIEEIMARTLNNLETLLELLENDEQKLRTILSPHSKNMELNIQ